MVNARHTVRSAAINVIVEAVIKAGRGLVRDFGEIEQLQVSRKGLGDFVSTADHRSERILIEELTKARPGYSFLVEESGAIEGTDPDHTWIIDPLDGTSNFLHGIPYFAVSVALKKNDDIIAGVIFNPITDELYWAEKGAGSYLNQRRLRVSARRIMEEALVGCNAYKSHLPETIRKPLESLMDKVSGMRYFGAATLDIAAVATGRYDAFIGHNLQPWDLAAAMVIVREAGGYVSTLSGTPVSLEKGQILATNDALNRDFLKQFQ